MSVHLHVSCSRILFLVSVASLSLADATGPPRPAAASTPSPQEIMELNIACADTARAAGTIPRLRRFLAGDPDASYVTTLRQFLLRALITSKAPTRQIVAQVDTVAPLIKDDPQTQVLFWGNLAQALIDRREQLDRALVWAQRSLAACPKTDEYRQVRGAVESILGHAHLLRGDAAAAVASLARAVSTSTDSQEVLLLLGQAYEKNGQGEQAIDAYIRSLGVFPGKDTTAAPALRALYVKRHGNNAGLAERIEASRKASSRRIALDTHRHEKPAPGWELPDLAGKTVRLSDYKGKVVVVDFWGSWCGPCRSELPYFQAAYERYKDRGVVFIGINWEREQTAEDHLKTAKKFIEANRYTFPVVIDHGREAVLSYEVQGFPTVYLIDGTGQIRYSNQGFDRRIEDILAAQIESLME